MDKDDLHDLGDIVDLISQRPERFVVFCDDLSFEDGESGYKALKVALDGSVAAQSDNVVIYATSNRRHLLPEYMSDNETYKHTSDGEIHPGEVVEEKISLSERFGLWVSFYPFKQDDYLTIVGHWLQHFGCDAAEIEAARGDALVWALERGSRSGRVAWQFARDWSGRKSRHDGLRDRCHAAANRTARPVTEVAVGVLVQPDGRYLLAQRPAGKPYEGYWEFPGGKLEAGEIGRSGAGARTARGAGDRRQGVPPLAYARARLPACLRAALLLQGDALDAASRTAAKARRLSGSRLPADVVAAAAGGHSGAGVAGRGIG